MLSEVSGILRQATDWPEMDDLKKRLTDFGTRERNLGAEVETLVSLDLELSVSSGLSKREPVTGELLEAVRAARGQIEEFLDRYDLLTLEYTVLRTEFDRLKSRWEAGEYRRTQQSQDQSREDQKRRPGQGQERPQQSSGGQQSREGQGHSSVFIE